MTDTSVLALAPMAGRGTRLARSSSVTGSKELAVLSEPTNGRAQVLSEVMLEHMLDAGITEAVLSIQQSKLDIQRHYGHEYRGRNGATMTLRYVFADDSPNTPTSIDRGFAVMRNRLCALGFADILYRPCAGYRRALQKLRAGSADIVLGLFPTQQATTSDMVAFDPEGHVQEILIKHADGGALQYTWSLAVWRPEFSLFMHDWLANRERLLNAEPSRADVQRELFVGDVVLAAMAAGLRAEAVVVSALPSLDAGTGESLARAQAVSWLSAPGS